MHHRHLSQTKAKPPQQKAAPKPVPTAPTPATADLVQLAQQDPTQLSDGDVMQLQRTIGNQAVHQLLRPLPTTDAIQREGPPAPAKDAPADETTAEEDPKAVAQKLIDGFNAAAKKYKTDTPDIDEDKFNEQMNSWYTQLHEKEKLIEDKVKGDDKDKLKTALHNAYQSAIREFMPKAASKLGKDVGELYHQNRGRIPIWAWEAEYNKVKGISTPVPGGAKKEKGEYKVAIGQFDVVIKPDAESDEVEDSDGVTKFDIKWSYPGYSYNEKDGVKTINALTPPRHTVTIQTLYKPGVDKTADSGYGRGTTEADTSGGKVTTESDSLEFHEGMHGMDFLQFLQDNPAPGFPKETPMTMEEYEAAQPEFDKLFYDEKEKTGYIVRMDEYSEHRTHGVGEPKH